MHDARASSPHITQLIQSSLTTKLNGAVVDTSVDTLNFIGANITLTGSGNTATIGVVGMLDDVLANRPSAASAPECLFYASDVNLFSFSNGTSWTTLQIDIINGTQGTLPIARGGTNATTASGARTNLGLGTAATYNYGDFDPAGAAATAQSNAEAFATAADVTVLNTAEAYADNAAEHIPAKTTVALATTTNITLSGIQTIDGFTVGAGQDVLVKDQSTASQNGIYVASSGAWTREVNADTASKLGGMFVLVEAGTSNRASMWFLDIGTGVITVGTTPLTYTRVAVPTDTDTTLAANSDLRTSTQKAVKAYVNAGDTAAISTAEAFATAADAVILATADNDAIAYAIALG